MLTPHSLEPVGEAALEIPAVKLSNLRFPVPLAFLTEIFGQRQKESAMGGVSSQHCQISRNGHRHECGGDPDCTILGYLAYVS